MMLDLAEYPTRGEVEDLYAAIAADFPDVPCHIRDHIGFRPEYMEWIRRGTKRCTIRFRHNELDLPSAFVLPIRETKPEDPSWRADLGELQIEKVVIKRFGLLTEEDCIWDGFKSIAEVQTALQRVYGPIRPDQFVTLYWFRIRSWSRPQ